jgi:glutathione S-transferase
LCLPDPFDHRSPSLKTLAFSQYRSLTRSSHSLVVIAASATALVNLYHIALTVSRRKASGYTYPTPYAPLEAEKSSAAAYSFNCAQRAHANFIENVPTFLATLLLSGLRFPLTSAALGGVWIASRVVYARGYANSKHGDKGKGRLQGATFWLPQMALIGTGFVSGWQIFNS